MIQKKRVEKKQEKEAELLLENNKKEQRGDGCGVIEADDPYFPVLLKQIENVPKRLYYRVHCLPSKKGALQSLAPENRQNTDAGRLINLESGFRNLVLQLFQEWLPVLIHWRIKVHFLPEEGQSPCLDAELIFVFRLQISF